MTVVLLILAVPVLLFVWTCIHELAHLVAAKLIVGADLIEFRPWPHTGDKGFRWGSVSWFWYREPTAKESAFVSLAPRIPNLVAALLLPVSLLLPYPWSWIVGGFLGAGLVDFLNGSVGKSEHSDLRKASVRLQVSPWLLRVIGLVAILVSLLASGGVIYASHS